MYKHSNLIEGFKTFKPKDQLDAIFKSKAHLLNPERQEAILLSNQGISACVLFAALRSLGNQKVEVYDGSFINFYQKKYQEHHQKRKR